MDTASDRPSATVENPTSDHGPLAPRDHHALRVGIGLLGVILVAGLTELAWPGDNTLVVMRTALFLFAGGVAVALLGREIGRLRKAEGRYSLVVAAADTGIWDWDVLIDEMFVSARAQSLYGLQPETTVRPSSEWRGLIALHPEDREAERLALEDCLAGRSDTYDGEWRVRHADGVYRWVRIRALCVRDATGRAMRMAGSVSDIDAKTRAQAALRFSEERAGLAMEASGDGHWDWSIPTDEFYASPRMLEMYGFPRGSTFATRSDFVAQVPFHPEDHRKWAEAIAAHFAGKTARFDIEMRMILRGETRWIHQTGLLSRDTSGKPLRWTGAVADITERKVAEAALRESEARFRNLTELSSDWYWQQDEDLRFTYLSRQADDLTGYTGQSSIGKRRWELENMTPVSGSWAEHQVVLAARQPFRDLELRRVGRDGVVRYLSVSGAPIFDEHGRFQGYQGVGSDITPRKRAAEALRQSEVRFRTLAGLSADWYWKQDENLRFTHSWSEVQDLAGFPGDPWLGKTRSELDGIKLLSGSWGEHEAILEARRPFRDFEYCRVGPDGIPRYMSVSGAPIFDEEGRFTGYEGIGRIITERKKIEQDLRDSEARFRSLTELSSDWYWEQDENLRFTYLPDGTNAGYPAPADASLGKTRRELGNKTTPVSSSWAEHEAVLAARQPFRDFEYGRLDEDGMTRYVSVSGAPIFDEEGRFKGYRGVGRNITERKQAEAALRESEARFRRLTKLSSDWYWRQDENLRFTEVWSELESQGYPALSSIGRTRWELAGIVTLLNSTWAEHKAVLEARQPFRDLEYSRMGPDGVVRYISISGVPIFDEDGRFKGYEGVGLNITERKRIEQDLRERQDILDFAQKAARAVAFEWRTGPGEGQNRWSPDLEAMYGLAPGSYDGTYDSWRNLIRPEDLPAVNAAMVGAAETGDVDVEYRVVHPNGAVHWLQARGRIFFDAERRPVRTVGFMLDVTERRQAELDQTRFRRFFDLPLIGIGFSSTERRFLDVNEKLCQILGYARAELIGRDWASITHPEDLGGNLDLLNKALSGERETYSMEKRYIHRDGHTVHANIIVSCVRASDGTADHFVLTVEDVTERHQAEEQRLKLERQLRQAQRLEAMGTLAGGIAHDFNNILGAILGYGEMALRGAAKGTRLRRDLDSIMTAGERGRALVERILAFSRSGVGERVAVHVERVAREALDQLAANLPANVTIFPRLRAGQAAVLGDSTQVHQVLMNLATNAIQAMPDGGTLRVSLEGVRVDSARVAMIGTLDAGDYVVLEVADTGVGIPADTLRRIFDPFFTTKEVGVGTGLGLSLVHGIVTELNGGIDVASTVGTGSVFTVYLPHAGDAADNGEREELEAPRGNREQVLIVDDEEPLVRLATETLADLGYAPLGFTSSSAALEAFRAEPERFDAVITDERMPGMTGSALIRELRGIRREIPILLMSGYVGDAVANRAREVGANEVMKKPLSARELASSLARVLRQ